eukprot:118879-Chlamydomonas_euryale.AAC.1
MHCCSQHSRADAMLPHRRTCVSGRCPGPPPRAQTPPARASTGTFDSASSVRSSFGRVCFQGRSPRQRRRRGSGGTYSTTSIELRVRLGTAHVPCRHPSLGNGRGARASLAEPQMAHPPALGCRQAGRQVGMQTSRCEAETESGNRCNRQGRRGVGRHAKGGGV